MSFAGFKLVKYHEEVKRNLGKIRLKFFNKDKVSLVTVRKGKKDDFEYERDFAKERRERQVWRPCPTDVFLDLP